MAQAPNFQRGDKVRQRAFAERANLCCCWDRRHAIELVRHIVQRIESSGSQIVDDDTVKKCVEFLEEIDR